MKTAQHNFQTISENETYSIQDGMNVTFINQGTASVEIGSGAGSIELGTKGQFKINISCCEYALCQTFKIVFSNTGTKKLLISEILIS